MIVSARFVEIIFEDFRIFHDGIFTEKLCQTDQDFRGENDQHVPDHRVSGPVPDRSEPGSSLRRSSGVRARWKVLRSRIYFSARERFLQAFRMFSDSPRPVAPTPGLTGCTAWNSLLMVPKLSVSIESAE